MNYFELFKGRIRALFTDFSSLLILLIIAAVSVFISGAGQDTAPAKIPIAIVNQDNGIHSSELIELLQLEDEYYFYITDEKSARKDIAQNRAHGMIVIKPDFSDRIEKGEYDSLYNYTVMSDSYDLNAFTEELINDTIKILTVTFVENKLNEKSDIGEEEINNFRIKAGEIWRDDTLFTIEPYVLGETDVEDESNKMYSGIRWFAALSLFYLMIGGTWMCDYGSRGLLKRATVNGGNIALLFISQALPGILVTSGMLIPILFVEKPRGSVLLIIFAYLIYAFGASGMALAVCSLSGKLSNLVLISPIITMAASLMSGLVCKLPDWAGYWDIISVILPGHWFHMAVQGKPFIIGAIISALLWFVLGMLTARGAGTIKRNHSNS